MDTGFPIVVCRVCLGLGFTVTPLLLAVDGGVRARVGVIAFVPPFLTRARGVCVLVRVSLRPRHSRVGLVVCVCLGTSCA